MAEPDDNPTRPYPADEQPTEQYADPLAAPAAPPKRKRKRGRIAIVVAVVLVFLLVIGYIVAERWIRGYAANLVKNDVVSALDLPNGEGVDVTFGPGSMLLQVITGSIDTVNLDVDEFTIGQLTGSASVVAHEVPLDEGAPINDLAIDFTITEANLAELVSTFSAGAIDDVGLDDGLISVTTEVEVLAFTLPVSLGLEPSTSDGDLVFTPENVTVNGAELTADQVRDSFIGSAAEPLLQPRSFCVAAQLPESLKLTGVRVDAQTLVLTLDGAGTQLSEEGFATKGSC